MNIIILVAQHLHMNNLSNQTQTHLEYQSTIMIFANMIMSLIPCTLVFPTQVHNSIGSYIYIYTYIKNFRAHFFPHIKSKHTIPTTLLYIRQPKEVQKDEIDEVVCIHASRPSSLDDKLERIENVSSHEQCNLAID